MNNITKSLEIARLKVKLLEAQKVLYDITTTNGFPERMMELYTIKLNLDEAFTMAIQPADLEVVKAAMETIKNIQHQIKQLS